MRGIDRQYGQITMMLAIHGHTEANEVAKPGLVATSSRRAECIGRMRCGEGRGGGSDWMRTVGLAPEALSSSGRAGMHGCWHAIAHRLCRPEAVMVRMEDAWMEPACPVRRAYCTSRDASHSRSTSSEGIGCRRSDNGGCPCRAVRRTCFSWPEGTALVSLHYARPGYWNH
jgi:hypothetical protein